MPQVSRWVREPGQGRGGRAEMVADEVVASVVVTGVLSPERSPVSCLREAGDPSG
jgi:hypothetical protein